MKAGVFQAFTNRILGLEGEVFGHGGTVKAPRTLGPAGVTQADGNLTVINTMMNLLARYSGEILQPYMGVGVGASFGTLRDTNIQSGFISLSGKANDAAFAYQVLAGARAYVGKKVFVFGEYKYFGAMYNFNSEGSFGLNPTTTFDFRTQIISGGVGFSF